MYDLLPDEPLTQSDGDVADLEYALSHCGWCGLELDEGAGRFAGFPLLGPERERLQLFEGRAFGLPIDDETAVSVIITTPDSEPASGPRGSRMQQPVREARSKTGAEGALSIRRARVAAWVERIASM